MTLRALLSLLCFRSRPASIVIHRPFVGQACTGFHDLPDRLVRDFLCQLGQGSLERHRPKIPFDPIAQAHRAGLGVTLADHDHVRDQLQLSVANLATQLLAAVIARYAEPSILEPRLDLASVLLGLLAHGDDAGLLGR